MDRLRPQRILGTGSHNSERCVEGEETCISPLRLLAAIAGIFFAVEALLMYVLAWVGWPSPLIVPWLDATLLVAVACPSLYLLVIRPLRVAIRRQMTEREQVTEELHKLSQAVEQSPTSILITDLGGCIQYVNPRFCKLTGYTREELLGQNPRLFKSGQNPPEIYQGLWKALKAGNEWRGE
jgi:PAS domain-containing protein